MGQIKGWIYTKIGEDLDKFAKILECLSKRNVQFQVCSETAISFQELEHLKSHLSRNDILIVSSLNSLGERQEDVLNQLDWFISKKHKLCIGTVPTTYQFGTELSTNQAVLATIKQSIIQVPKNNVYSLSQPINPRGRPKIPFPDGWDGYYQQWVNKEISSKTFLEKSGLKKATFYNMLADYQELTQKQEDFFSKYRIS